MLRSDYNILVSQSIEFQLKNEIFDILYIFKFT
jgi:hypothetical protein